MWFNVIELSSGRPSTPLRVNRDTFLGGVEAFLYLLSLKCQDIVHYLFE